jgi:hypothetical protein
MARRTTESSFDELAKGLAEGSISRRRALKLFAGTAIAALIPSQALAAGKKKFCVCHRPAGDPTKQKTLCFSNKKAQEAHIRHGDPKGECPKTTTTTTTPQTTTTTPPPGVECSVGGQTITCPPGQQCCPGRGCFIPGDVVCCQTPAGVGFCPLPEAQCCPEGCIPSDSVCGEPVPCPSAPGGFCPPGAVCTDFGCVIE